MTTRLRSRKLHHRVDVEDGRKIVRFDTHRRYVVSGRDRKFVDTGTALMGALIDARKTRPKQIVIDLQTIAEWPTGAFDSIARLAEGGTDVQLLNPSPVIRSMVWFGCFAVAFGDHRGRTLYRVEPSRPGLDQFDPPEEVAERQPRRAVEASIRNLRAVAALGEHSTTATDSVPPSSRTDRADESRKSSRILSTRNPGKTDTDPRARADCKSVIPRFESGRRLSITRDEESRDDAE